MTQDLLKLQAKQRLIASQVPELVATEEPIDPIDTADEPGAGATPNPNAFFANADSDSVAALEETREQALKVVDETTRALEARMIETLLANDTFDFEELPVANTADMTKGKADAQAADTVESAACPSETLDENEHPNTVLNPEGDMTMNASPRYFTKAEALAAFAEVKAAKEAEHGRSLTSEEVVAMLIAEQDTDAGPNEEPFDYEKWKNSGKKSKSADDKKAEASFIDDVSSGDAFDMLIDGDPSQEEPVVQELTTNDGGTEEPSDQNLLRDDLPQGPDSI